MLISQQPARCCAVAMGSTPKDAACATAAGRAPSAMCLQLSASIPSVGAGASASWALVPATLDTKEKTVKKVNEKICTPAPAVLGHVSSWHVQFYQFCWVQIICTKCFFKNNFRIILQNYYTLFIL